MRIAIVGSGVSGLAATWLLNEYSDHEVHLYESDSRPGGHANTVCFHPPGGGVVNVDTGFIVLNPVTYPNFLRFLNLFPSIPVVSTEMTFSISRDNGQFEWAGNNLLSLFCQPSRLLDPSMWRMLYDVLRFNACARELLAPGQCDEELSIGEYLKKEGYSDAFRDNYLIPMTAAIWSTPPDKCTMGFPARTLIQFFNNHNLLQITGKPSWLTVKGGSKLYVNTILSNLPPQQLHLSTPVKSLSTSPSSPGVTLTTTVGREFVYDHVVLACHSDQSLSILRTGTGMTADEAEILAGVRWNYNEVVLHADPRLMPKSRRAWSCWNYLTKSAVDEYGRPKANIDQVALTYGMNDLQHISEEKYGPVLATLNAPFEPQPETIGGRWKYSHPVLDSEAAKSQSQLPAIQNTRSISYAGAWTRYGFHEDGFTSGMHAVLDYIPEVRPPFQPTFYVSTARRAWLAKGFEMFEESGVRALVGWWLSALLVVCRRALGIVIDLEHF